MRPGLRTVYFLDAVRALAKGGDLVVENPLVLRSRLIACQNCRWRENRKCPVIHCGCVITNYAVFKANDCPAGKWPTSPRD
jgi:hypothetical protein